MDGYDHLFKLLLIGDAGVGKSRCDTRQRCGCFGVLLPWQQHSWDIDTNWVW